MPYKWDSYERARVAGVVFSCRTPRRGSGARTTQTSSNPGLSAGGNQGCIACPAARRAADRVSATSSGRCGGGALAKAFCPRFWGHKKVPGKGIESGFWPMRVFRERAGGGKGRTPYPVPRSPRCETPRSAFASDGDGRIGDVLRPRASQTGTRCEARVAGGQPPRTWLRRPTRMVWVWDISGTE